MTHKCSLVLEPPYANVLIDFTTWPAPLVNLAPRAPTMIQEGTYRRREN